MKKTFAYTALSQVVLLAIAQSAIANEQTVQLDEITVDGGSMYRMGEVPFHQAKSAVAISREDLDKQDVKKVDEIARYQAGFANQIFGSDTNTNWFRVRGTEVSQAVNGLPTFSYGFFTPYVESFGLEAIEVTKGADSMTFGAAQSGGLINYVTKRAHRDQIGKGEFKTNVGDSNGYGFGVDYTGKITNDENVRYRVVASLNNEEGDWKDTNNKTLYIAPNLEWDISDRTHLSILTSYQKDYGTPSSNFFPAYGTLVPAQNGYIHRSTNLGDPVNDTESNKQYSLGYELSHDFGNGLRANSSYRYSHLDNLHRGSYAFTSVAPSDDATSGVKVGDVARGVVFNDGKAVSHALDNRLSWDYKNDWLKNTVVVGTDYRHNKVDTMYDPFGFGATTSTNIYNEKAGWNQAQKVTGTHNIIKARQLGFYLQNNARFADSYVLGLGIRNDRAKQDEYTRSVSVKDNHTSYSASFMYESPFGINPYVSYSESFVVPTGISGKISSTDTLYDPNITRQYEAGIKYVPTWLDGTISIAGFRAKDIGALKVTGVGLTESSDDPVYRKGFELQADVNFTPNWTGTLAYTYTKSETKITQQSTADTTQKSVGEKFRNHYIPTNTLSARTAYTFNGNALEGLTVGAGIRYVGHSTATVSKWNAYSGARVPSATVVDLMARYAIDKNWTAQVNLDNVGNRRYVAACDSYCYYGQERKVNASLSYKF